MKARGRDILFLKTQANSKILIKATVQAPRGSSFMGLYKFESDRSFTKIGTKSEERIELEAFVNEMLASPTNKAIGFGSSFK